MKALAKVVVVVACAGFVAGCAGTSEAKKDVYDITPGVSQKETGLIQRVGPNEIWVLGVEHQTQAISFALSPKTVVERGNERVGLTQLQAGTPVRVAFESEAGAERATRIEVLTGAEADQVRRDVQRDSNSGY